jgi:glyoxylase-like metal-dependent hydrolase (beta-lactamase superfamily II)
MAIPFVRDLAFRYGEAAPVTPLIRRVVANNPGPFTYFGTGSYVIGHGKVAIVDPGPDDPAHIGALLDAVRNETVTHILVTHTHRDHSPGAAALQQATGAPTYGYGPHPVREGMPTVEEGGDHGFRPDVTLADGDVVSGAGWTAEAVHTPGHLSNHLCFGVREDQALLSGDHVMGWSTTVISPPDGDMKRYMESLDKLLARDDRLLIPTHGGAIEDPKPFVRAYAEHRRERERQILKCLDQGIERIPDMVKKLYAAVDPRLHGAAGRSVLAHLIHLVETGQVETDGPPDTEARFRLKR